MFTSPRLTRLSRSSSSSGFETLRRCLALLLAYSTTLSTMPVQAGVVARRSRVAVVVHSSLGWHDPNQNGDVRPFTIEKGGVLRGHELLGRQSAIDKEAVVSRLKSRQVLTSALQAPQTEILTAQSTVAQAGSSSAPACLYALDPSAQGAFSISGSTSITTSCSIVDESSATQAFQMSGSEKLYLQNNAQVGVVGGWLLNGQTRIVNQTNGQSVSPVKISSPGDPLASVTAPTQGAIIARSHTSYDMNNRPPNNTLSPGVYCGGLTIGNTNGSTFTMSPGTYVMAGGGLTINSLAVVSGSGVTVYNTSSTAWGCSGKSSYTPIAISGQANVTLSAPRSGTLADVLLFGDRTGCSKAGSCQDQINGGASTTLTGALYFKSDTLLYSGNNSSTGCMIAVADMISFNGNTGFAVHGCAPPIANAGPPQTVPVGATVQLDGTASSDETGTPLTYIWTFVSVPGGSSATLSSSTSAKPTFVADVYGNYTIQLIVNDGYHSSAPSQVTISTQDSPPIANAGPNQTVSTNTLVRLNGSGSTDVDGQPLTYAWSFKSLPAGSAAVLSNPTAVNPSFTTDKKGNYVLQLIVNDGILNSAPSTVTISNVNSPPVANAGPDQTVNIGTTVQLNGSGSTDVDGDSLTYRWWFLSIPAGSSATLSNSTIVNPTFVADVPGNFVLQLIVNDGTVDSPPSTVTIGNQDIPPVANAGPPQTVPLGAMVTLDATRSTDSDGKPLTYQWSLVSMPAGSTATLAQPTSPNPYFTADLAGNYIAQLIVNDGFLSSTPSTVTISTSHSVPVANAGPDQTVTIGATVQLTGAASYDVDGYPLTYRWALLSQPSGGTALLSSTTIVNPTFVANAPGAYVAQLIVNDGVYDSSPATVMITANPPNQPPVVNAGQDQIVTLPVNSVKLNGTASDDGLPTNTLTVSWSEISGPAGVVFDPADKAVTTATFPTAGTYVLQLTADDSQLTSSSTVTVTVNPPVNRPPVVTAGPNQTIPIPNVFSLQGSSLSANTPPGLVTSVWTQISGPSLTITDPSSPTSVATFTVPGVYILQLTGTEKNLSSSSQVTITAIQGNLSPVVNAGPDQSTTIPINTVTLSGSATDDGLPQGSALSYAWSTVSGPGTVSFSSPLSPASNVSFSAAGTYRLRLTASDSQLSGSADVRITVLPQNNPPQVNAGPDQTITLPVNVALLAGTASDDGLPAGNSLTTTWSLVSGPGAVQFGDVHAATTTALFTTSGVYQLRLTGDDSQYRTTSDVTITVNAGTPALSASIVLTPANAGQILVGTSQQFQATLRDATGMPIVGTRVTFDVVGANGTVGAATTDGNGVTAFAYTGTIPGLDQVTATATSGSLALTSNTSPVSWVNSSPAVSPSAITGQFFASDGSGTFDTPSNAAPVFGQTFDVINFNPPAGLVPGAPASIDVTTRPFTDVETDASGNYAGTTIAQGNGLQAGVGTLAAFQAVFTGTLSVAAAGNVTFRFFTADGFVFGIGNGATRVSGSLVQPPSSGVTPFHSYPVMGSFNTVTAPVANLITAHFPAAGTYVYELDYAVSTQNSLIAPGSLWKYSLNNPAGFQQPSFDDSSFAEGLSPFTNAIGGQSPGFSCPLIGASFFPVVGTLDLRKTIYLPPGISNVTAKVAIDNDFTLWINGTQITNVTSEGCAFEWNSTVNIPDSVWVPGNNVVAFQARDRGGATGFETELVEGGTTGSSSITKPISLIMNVNKVNGQSGVALALKETYPNLGLTGLCGAFTDDSGRVIEPISIGSPSQSFVVPLGATRLQLGTNDDKYSDNSGSGYVAKVNATTFTVPPTAMPWNWVAGGLNSGYQYGIQDGSGPITPLTGLVQGQVITVSYQSGTVSAGPGFPSTNADGDMAIVTSGNTGSTGKYFPTAYMTARTYNVGQAVTLIAAVSDSNGALVPNQAVTLNIAGANPQQFQAVTDNSGIATFTYHGFVAGTDIVQAQALIAGAIVVSGQDAITWNGIPNQPPVVNAGSNQTLTFTSDATTVLTGTATDDGLPNGTLVESWTQIAGPATAFISTPAQLSTVVVFTQPGVYQFQLTASDSLLSTSSTVQVTVTQPNQPPVINITADTTTLTLPANSVNVVGTITDDGLPAGSTPAAQWSMTSGPAPVSFSNPTSPNTRITFPQPGTYVLSLSASDSQLSSAVQVSVTVNPAAPNQAPVVAITASQTGITLPNNVITLAGKVTDDGLPVGGGLTLKWSQLSGPLPATFSNAQTAVTQVGFPAVGVYVLQLSASDSQLTGSANITITVNATGTLVNQPPTAAIVASQTTLTLPLNSATLTAIVNDDGLPNGNISLQWAQTSGPVLASLSQNTSTSIKAAFPTVGVYAIQLTASDGQLSSTAGITITVINPGGNQPPTVNAGPNQTVQLPQNTVTLNGFAADDGLPQGSAVSSLWTQVSGPAGVVFSNPSSAITQATFSSPGVYVLQLQANDSQLQSSSQTTITVNSQPVVLPPLPTVNLTGLVDGMEVTSPISVAGSITLDQGTWALSYSQNSGSAPVWTPFASGPGNGNTQVSGTFDPTILLNGQYTIRLQATDNFGQTSTIDTVVNVSRNVKLANFTVTFNDLTVSMPTLPIQITRTYDSRDKSTGDFGVGWTLGLKNVRLQKSRNLGQNWFEDVSWSGLFPQYCLTPPQSFVTVTFPDGRVYKFQTISSPSCQSFAPITAPVMAFSQVSTGASTAGATLVALNEEPLTLDGAVPGPVNVVDFDLNIYNPTAFVLTTKDGITYMIDQTLGATQVKDLNGNTLTINASGITSSTGQNVVFVRDGQNRITQIQDPSGNTLSYAYSGDGDLASFTDPAQNQSTYAYQNHYLTTITDPRGVQPIRNNYDNAGRLLSTTDANGKTITYSPNLSTNNEQITDRLGNITTYGYDSDGNITSETDALGHTSTYTYDANDNKLSETNALGKTTSYTYDNMGNRLSETDPLGNKTTYTYNARGQVLTVTDPQGHATTNVYDSNGNLTSTTDANGKSATTVYNSNGTPQSVTDANGKTTRFQYDGSGNLSQQTDALQNISTYTYDNNGNRKNQTVTRTVNGQPQTLTTNYEYDGNNRLTKTTYPDGTSTRTEYNNIGKQSATYDQFNRKTSYDYDTLGRLTTTTYPDQTTGTATYDAENNRLSSTDRVGHTTSYTYDADKRLIKTTYADQSFTQTNFDPAGRVQSTIDANGNATTFAYDDAGRRTSITDALNHVTTFTYDQVGNQTSVKDANQHTTQYEYDSLNRQVKVTYPDLSFSSTAYDALGRVSSKTDQAGRVTAYGYDDLGRLTSVTQDAVAGGLNLVTQYGYDEVGNRISQTDANNHSSTYTYDKNGRRVGRTLPLGQSESYAYDSAGNPQSKTDFNGKITTYAYDSSNRLLSKTPDASFLASPIAFTYFPNGLRQTMSDPSGTTTYAYDTRNRLTSKQTPFGTLGYTYDSAGNLLTLKSSNAGGISDTYTYDGLNRLSTVTDPSGATTYSYDNVGNLAGYTYPNGVATSYTYDQLNRLTQMGSAKGGALSSYTYTLGPAGNRTSVAELSGRTVSYGYDALYRLTSETITADPAAKNGTVGYTYDAVSNRKQMSSTLNAIPAGLFNYNANDQLATDTYDANGNTVSSAGITSTYDFENHLVQKGAVTVVYDGDGNRVAETVGGVTTNYLVDTLNPTGYAQVVEELVSGSVTKTYSFGLERISQNRQLGTGNSQLSFYGYDGHGSVRNLTDATGAVTDSYDYDAFGNLINSTGSTPNNYLFAGEQYDAALGLYYNRARYLNTTTGRFWSADSYEGSFRDPLTLHRYLYVANNTPNATDPTGHDYDLGSLAAVGGAITTLASTSYVVFQNVVGSIYVGLYEVPQVVETANNYLTVGLGAFEALRMLGTNVLNYAESYSRGPAIRGNQFEEAAGANLGRTFPALDYFDPDTGAAVQIRSTTQTQSMDALLGVVQKGVNRLNSAQYPLTGYDRAGNPITITQEQVKAKGLLVGIPAKPLPWFNAFIQKVQQVSQSEGVEITVQFVEGLEGETPEK